MLCPEVFHAFLLISGPCTKGPFRGPSECTVASVFQLEAESPRVCCECAPAELVEREELCFSSFLLDNAISSEAKGTGRRVGVGNPCIAHAGVVPHPSGPVRVPSSPFTHESPSLARAL